MHRYPSDVATPRPLQSSVSVHRRQDGRADGRHGSTAHDVLKFAPHAPGGHPVSLAWHPSQSTPPYGAGHTPQSTPLHWFRHVHRHRYPSDATLTLYAWWLEQSTAASHGLHTGRRLAGHAVTAREPRFEHGTLPDSGSHPSQSVPPYGNKHWSHAGGLDHWFRHMHCVLGL